MKEKNIIILICFIGIATRLIFMLTTITIKIEHDRSNMYKCIAENIWCDKYKN